MYFPFKRLRELMNEFDTKFDRINWGGCGFMASILAYQLQWYVDDMKIVSCGYNGDGDIDEARNNIERNTMWEWSMEGIDFNHVWVEFKWCGTWYAIDCEGLHRRKDMHKRWQTPSKGSFTINEMRGITRGGGWNWAFNRGQVPAMRKLASRRFAQIFAEANG